MTIWYHVIPPETRNSEWHMIQDARKVKLSVCWVEVRLRSPDAKEMAQHETKMTLLSCPTKPTSKSARVRGGLR